MRKGQPNVVSRLAREGINKLFEELGGVLRGIDTECESDLTTGWELECIPDKPAGATPWGEGARPSGTCFWVCTAELNFGTPFGPHRHGLFPSYPR